MSDAIVERRGKVQIITINRPQAKNALNLEVATIIRDAVDELDASDDLSVAILTGGPDVFSSGMDLKGFLRGESPSFEGRGLCGIQHTPPKKPIIAAVEGYALAAGFELTLACDMVIAGRTAKFGIPEVKRGLVAAGGGAWVAAQRIPLAVAMELVLTGDPFDAERAAAFGLITRVVDAGGALDAALEMAQRIVSNGPLAVQASKVLARRAQELLGEEGYAEAAKIFGPVFNSEDAREGATAFAEKRAPAWKGR